MLPVARKDVLPATPKNFVIYDKCHCDSRYVGRTSQRLQDRIKQHVSQWLRQQLTRLHRSRPHRLCKRNDTKPDCDFAIGQHLLKNDQCALNYDNRRFSILATAHSCFDLDLSEAAYIKTRRTILCRQKEFVYTLKLLRYSRHLASCCAFSNFRRNLSLPARWRSGESVRIAVGRSRLYSPCRVISKDFKKWYSQLSCLALSIKKG